MNRGRSPLKYRPKPETFNGHVQSGVRTGHTGYNRTDSLSKLEGDLSKKKKAVESPGARKDELQRGSPTKVRAQSESPNGRYALPTAERRLSLPGTNLEKNHAPVLSRTNSEKNHAPVLSRTNSERNLVPGLPRSNSGQFNKNGDDSKRKEEDDSNKEKKLATRNFMKHTRSFNAKSQKPMDLTDERVRKKAEHDPSGIQKKIKGFCAKTCRNPYCSLNHNKPVQQKTFSYLKSRSRSPSLDSQNSPRNLRDMNSIEKQNSNLSGSAKQSRQDKKKREIEETEVCEKVVEEIKHENEEPKGNENESLLEVEENETDMKKLFEGQESLLEFEKNEINMKDEAEVFEKDNSKKHEVLNENISENNNDEVSSPLDTVTEILEKDRVIDENVSETEINETNELENSFALETIHEDENSEKYKVIDTKYDDISDLYVLSSCNDEIDSSLQEISIEEELSKLTGPIDSKFDEFKSIDTELNKENQEIVENNNFVLLTPIIEDTQLNKKNQEIVEYNNSALVTPIIEDIITNEIAKMGVDSTEDEEKEEEKTETKRGSKKWLVDYALRKLIKKLETSEKLNDANKVSMLVEAYENVILLAMCRKVASRQASGY